MKNMIDIQFKVSAIDLDQLTLEELHVHQRFAPVGGANVHVLSPKTLYIFRIEKAGWS